ncbi:hypothetical protein GCM10023403_47420 [Pseudonocardia benzenivorans]
MLRRRLLPEGFDEHPDGDELAGPLGQHGERAPGLADGHDHGLLALYGERAEQAQPQVGPGHARTLSGSQDVT